MKMMKLAHLCIEDSNGLKKKLLRYITLDVTDANNVCSIIERLKRISQDEGIRSFYVFKPVDGSKLNEWTLFIGSNSWEDFGKTDSLVEKISAIETELKLKAITSVFSETLIYRADMSLFSR
jgi:hypothetical protein